MFSSPGIAVLALQDTMSQDLGDNMRIHMGRSWLSLTVAALSCLGVAACGDNGGTPAAETIKIGVAGPLTGPNAAFGAQLKNGAEQAVADINAAGGINGKKVEL
ncbi:MAG: ABC transporter substrate-binding protein, partial [Pseudomonadota bacterium]